MAPGENQIALESLDYLLQKYKQTPSNNINTENDDQNMEL
jgi:hypothetical protein